MGNTFIKQDFLKNTNICDENMKNTQNTANSCENTLFDHRDCENEGLICDILMDMENKFPGWIAHMRLD